MNIIIDKETSFTVMDWVNAILSLNDADFDEVIKRLLNNKNLEELYFFYKTENCKFPSANIQLGLEKQFDENGKFIGRGYFENNSCQISGFFELLKLCQKNLKSNSQEYKRIDRLLQTRNEEALKSFLLEDEKDKVQITKNMAEFNKEWEAYNKSLMYGTDVLSCLNKAQNNNQKYVYSSYYGASPESMGSEQRAEYFVDVQVTLNSPLYDTFKAYYRNSKGTFIQIGSIDPISNDNFKVSLSSTGFKDPVIYYYYFKEGKLYQDSGTYTKIMWNSHVTKDTLLLGNILTTNGGKIETKIKKVNPETGKLTYNLLEMEDKRESGWTSSPNQIENAARFSALISTTSIKDQKIQNTKTPSSYSGDDWYYYTWESAAKDFKKRKFKCTGVDYNIDTGYVQKLTFEEV